MMEKPGVNFQGVSKIKTKRRLMMKNFRWIMIFFISIYFIIGTGSQGWSAEAQKGMAIEPQKKPIVIRDSTLKLKPPPQLHQKAAPHLLKANLRCAHLGRLINTMPPFNEGPEPAVIQQQVISIVNNGPGIVKKGGKISWETLYGEKQSGIITLKSDLKKGWGIWTAAKRWDRLSQSESNSKECKVSVEKYVPPMRAKPPTPPVRKK